MLQSYGKLKQSNISETIDFFNTVYGTKIVNSFRYPLRNGPAVTLFDGFILSQFKSYELEFSHYMIPVFNFCIKLWIKIFVSFENKNVSRKTGVFGIFSYVFAYSSGTTSYLQKSDCFTQKSVTKSFSITIVFHWKIIFIRYKYHSLDQIDQFSPYFFFNQARLVKYGWFKQFEREFQFSTKKTLFVQWFLSHKLIINEIYH